MKTKLKYALQCVFATFVITLALPNIVLSDCADDLEDLLGYTIVASKTITGWRDDEEKDGGSFNGCSHPVLFTFRWDKAYLR